jgi:hypothetical protein
LRTQKASTAFEFVGVSPSRNSGRIQKDSREVERAQNARCLNGKQLRWSLRISQNGLADQ